MEELHEAAIVVEAAGKLLSLSAPQQAILRNDINEEQSLPETASSLLELSKNPFSIDDMVRYINNLIREIQRLAHSNNLLLAENQSLREQIRTLESQQLV